MEIRLEKRTLSESETILLVEEIKKFPNPLTSKNSWQLLKKVYILYNNENLIGVCGIGEFQDWIKLGPFVILEKYHQMGFGKQIIQAIVRDYSEKNLYIGSRNPGVAVIAKKLGFQEVKNKWDVPAEIKSYLVKSIIKSINLEYLKELIRKKSSQEGPFRIFLRKS